MPMTNEQKNAAKKAVVAAKNAIVAEKNAAKITAAAANVTATAAEAEKKAVIAVKNAVVANAANKGSPITGGARRSASHKQALRRLNKAMTKINNACKNKKRSTRRRNH